MFIAAFAGTYKYSINAFAMEDYKKKLGSLADKIKNETLQTPIQQVIPVKSLSVSIGSGEARFNNWIQKGPKEENKGLWRSKRHVTEGYYHSRFKRIVKR